MISRIVALTFVLAIAHGHDSEPSAESSSESSELDHGSPGNDSRIVGGIIAAPAQFPYQVYLVGSSFKCGGSIVGPRWVLTAAHCLTVTYVVAGTNRLSSGGTRYNIIWQVRHPQYNPTTIVNDVGLLKTDRTILYSAAVRPIDLPTADINTASGCFVSGWGQISNPGPISNDLRYLVTNVISLTDCRNRCSCSLPTTNLCTIIGAGKGNCFGDSGGPLRCGNALVGVVSWVFPCAINYPDGYARVFPFVNWIKFTMLNN